jgi:hypothetical protein
MENGPPNQAGVVILVSDKADSRPKFVRRDNEVTSFNERR